MISVGFVITRTNESWLGGLNYFRNLLTAICEDPDRSIDPVIFTGLKDDKSVFRDFPRVRMIHSRLLDRLSLPWVLRKMIQTLLGRDYLLELLLKRSGVRLMSHSGFLGSRSRIPTLGWIPDFQHRHLTGFFSAQERSRRDKMFENTARFCTRVVLSSQDSRKDFVKFCPQYAAKSEVLPFVVGPPQAANTLALAQLREKYSIPETYFLLPNQFWEHKNHRVVVEALSLLKNEGRKVVVICTGNSQDSRQPWYFGELMQKVQSLGLEREFRTLGIVPYSDLVSLIREAIALINPSLFEGWSTTVEEAKSLGKTIIVSDIGVHREQAPQGGIYFDPRNPRMLADCMWTLLNDRPSGRELFVEAERALPGRRRDFYRKYAEIVQRTSGGD